MTRFLLSCLLPAMPPLICVTTALAQNSGALDCASAEREYQERLLRLERGCAKGQDCRSDDLSWTRCDWYIAHSSATQAQDLGRFRRELQGRCGYVVAPCPSLFSEPICLDGRCRVLNDLEKLKGRSITLQFMRKNKPIRNKKFVLTSSYRGDEMTCVGAACQQPAVLSVLLTDKAGKASLPIELIKTIVGNRDRRTGLHWARLGIAGLGEKDLDTEGLLLDTQRVQLVEF